VPGFASTILALGATLQVASYGGTRVWGSDQAVAAASTTSDLTARTPSGSSNTFGEAASGPSSQYNGRVFDPGTGFHDYGARMYWPQIGRFISADSVIGSTASPMSLNRYSYVLNNPYKYTDPTGNCPWCVAGAVIGFGVDFAAQALISYSQDKPVFENYDVGQGLAAAAAGAITGGASAFIGTAIEGAGVAAVAGRAAANAAVGSAVSAYQAAYLNEVDGHHDDVGKAALVGGAFGAASSALGDAALGLASKLARPMSPGEANFVGGLQKLNGINPQPAGVVAGQAVGSVVGGGTSLVPLEKDPAKN
jgi:RHS repeat-associated protein